MLALYAASTMSPTSGMSPITKSNKMFHSMCNLKLNGAGGLRVPTADLYTTNPNNKSAKSPITGTNPATDPQPNRTPHNENKLESMMYASLLVLISAACSDSDRPGCGRPWGAWSASKDETRLWVSCVAGMNLNALSQNLRTMLLVVVIGSIKENQFSIQVELEGRRLFILLVVAMKLQGNLSDDTRQHYEAWRQGMARI